MSNEVAPVFVEWEERVICPERGNRVIHFYLKDASGNSVLAVVGTERSVRHMLYVVPDRFLQVYGSNESINAYRWRSRREVLDWLTCLTSPNRPRHNGVESLKMLTAGLNARKKLLPDKMISRKLKFQNSDIEWSGIAWFCAKQLKHYPGFCRDRTTIYVHSFVYIMAEEERHYLGYLEDMYEDKKRQKKVKVRWFHHGQEVKHVFPELNPQEGEVIITPHVQVISAECVNGPATVLTPNHYEKYLAAAPHTSLSEIHMCFRQFKNNKLKPFALTKLRGYSNQSVLSCLDSPILSKRKAKCHKLHTEDGDHFTQDDPLRSRNKRIRSSTGYQVLEKGFSDLQISAPLNGKKKCEPKHPSLKLKLSRKTMGIKVIGPKPQYPRSFKVDEKIEFLCQDSGIRGCWFRCKILSTSQKKLKVQYDDVLDVDGPEKLEEWILASRVAAPDKLGMRCSGRLTVRPRPPEDSTDHTFEIGAAVDAWWCDGWWEGVVISVNFCGVGILQVYSPGEEKIITVDKKNIRISRDWIGNRWVDILGNPNICSYLPSNVNSGIKLSANSAVADGSIPSNVSSSIKLSANSAVADGSMSDCSAMLESKPPSIPKVEVAQKVVPKPPSVPKVEVAQKVVPKPPSTPKVDVAQKVLPKPPSITIVEVAQKVVPKSPSIPKVEDAQKVVPKPPSTPKVDVAQKVLPKPPSIPIVEVAQKVVPKPPSIPNVEVAQKVVPKPPSTPKVYVAQKVLPKPPSIPIVEVSQKVVPKPPSIPNVEAAQKVEPELSGLVAPDDLVESMKGITLRQPLPAIHEDKDDNSDGGSDNVYDRKQLHAIDEEDKDSNSGAGGEGEGVTDKDSGGNDADNAEKDSEDNLMEKKFDCAEPKRDAAQAIQVT